MAYDRRGEAHLWLLLEEALVAVRRGGADVGEVRRNFRSVGEALATTGLVPRMVTAALVAELDDALAVRALLDASAFHGREFPAVEAMPTPAAPVDLVGVWLEAEVERHVEIVAGFDPAVRPEAGAEALRILGGPVRAFEAAGALGTMRVLVDDFAASLVSAGFDAGRARTGWAMGRVRREWVRFLRERPPASAEPLHPVDASEPRLVVGEVGGRSVRVDAVAWSEHLIEVRLTVRPASPAAPPSGDWTPWYARAMDGRGRLHLGPPSTSLFAGGTGVRFRLRPGLRGDARRLDLRVTCGAHRAETRIPL